MTAVKKPLLDLSPEYSRRLPLGKKIFAGLYLSPLRGGRKLTSEPRKSREWNWDEHVKRIRSLRYVGAMLFIDLYIITDVSFCINCLTVFHASCSIKGSAGVS